MGPEGDGFYFRANHKYFGISEIEIAESFPITIDDHIFRMISFSEFEIEYDGDRFYPESFSFMKNLAPRNLIRIFTHKIKK